MGFYTKEVENKYLNYLKMKRKARIGIILHFCVWLLVTGLLAYERYVGITGVSFIGIKAGSYSSADRPFYEVPLCWLLLIFVQLAFYYAEHLPLLAKWQDFLERKEFKRLKQTYEYQLKEKNETSANSYY